MTPPADDGPTGGSSADRAIMVLHVDDDPDFADLVGLRLEGERDDLRVETADSAETGLERLAESDVDCVVSDYQMPGRDGLSFLEDVREIHGDLPFILFTGRGSEEIASEAISAGVTDYLQKGSGTARFALLANRIANAVERYRSRQELSATRHRFEALVTESTDAIFVVDPAGQFEYVTPSVTAVLGYDPDELVGENGFDRIHPDDVEQVMAEYATVVEQPGSRADVEFRFEHAEGGWVRVEARGRNLLDDPAVGGIVVYARDIEDRLVRNDLQ